MFFQKYAENISDDDDGTKPSNISRPQPQRRSAHLSAEIEVETPTEPKQVYNCNINWNQVQLPSELQDLFKCISALNGLSFKVKITKLFGDVSFNDMTQKYL